MRTRAVTCLSPATPKLLGIGRQHVAWIEPDGTLEGAVVPDDLHVAVDAVDPVGTQLVVPVVATEHVPEAVAQHQSVGIDAPRTSDGT